MNEWWLLGSLFLVTLLASFFLVYPLRKQYAVSRMLVPLILILAWGGYSRWGSFGLWQDYIEREHKQKQAAAVLKSIKSPHELIKKLRARLDDSPESAKGWYLLGRLYAGQDEQQNAVDSFAKAYQLKPDSEQYAVNYAHNLWQLNHHQFTVQVTDIFNNLLKNNPNQPDALAMLAMESFARQNYEQAISYWQRLLKLAAPQSEESQAIRKAIAKAEARIKQGKQED